VPDEPAALEERLREAATLADVVLTSGGISAGEADHTRAMLQRLGTVQFWRVAMRPGRPLAVGLLAPAGGISLTRSAGIPIKTSANRSQDLSNPPPTQRPAVLLGLPGNPVAAMVSFLMFVRPALAMLAGERSTPVPLLQAISSERLRKRPAAPNICAACSNSMRRARPPCAPQDRKARACSAPWSQPTASSC
jgi:molybdopterin molybdotransferase